MKNLGEYIYQKSLFQSQQQNNQNTQGLQTQLDAHTIQINNLSNINTQQDNLITAIQNLDTVQATDILNNLIAIQNNDADILALQQKDGLLDNDIIQINNDIVTLSTATGVQQGQINQNIADIGTLQGQVSNIGTDLTALQNEDINLQGQITSNDGDITTLQNQDVALQNQITTNSNNIGTLQGQMTTANNNITTANNNIGTLQGQIITANNNITTANNNITTNTNDITASNTSTRFPHDISKTTRIETNEAGQTMSVYCGNIQTILAQNFRFLLYKDLQLQPNLHLKLGSGGQLYLNRGTFDCNFDFLNTPTGVISLKFDGLHTNYSTGQIMKITKINANEINFTGADVLTQANLSANSLNISRLQNYPVDATKFLKGNATWGNPVIQTETTGLLDVTRLNISGVPTGGKFLKDDGSWSVVPSGFSGNYQDLQDIANSKVNNAFVLSTGPTTQAFTDYNLNTIQGTLSNGQITTNSITIDKINASITPAANLYMKALTSNTSTWSGLDYNDLINISTIDATKGQGAAGTVVVQTTGSAQRYKQFVFSSLGGSITDAMFTNNTISTNRLLVSGSRAANKTIWATGSGDGSVTWDFVSIMKSANNATQLTVNNFGIFDFDTSTGDPCVLRMHNSTANICDFGFIPSTNILNVTLSASNFMSFLGDANEIQVQKLIKCLSGCTVTGELNNVLSTRLPVNDASYMTQYGIKNTANLIGSTQLINASVGVGKLSATGTPSITTYLRGDNTWSTIPGGFSGNYQDLQNITGIKGVNTIVVSSGANNQAHTFFSLSNIAGQLVNAQITDGVISLSKLSATGIGAAKFLRGDNAWVDLPAAFGGNFTDLSGTLANTQIPVNEITISKLAISGVPDSTKFLRDDGSWQTIALGGTNYEALQNISGVKGSNTIVVSSDASNQAHTAFSLSNIAGQLVNAQITDGVISLSKLSATGIGASKFLRGDNVWVDLPAAFGGNFTDLSGQLANAQIPVNEITISKINATGTADNTTYLRGDGIWSVIPAGFDGQFSSLTGQLANAQITDGVISLSKLSATGIGAAKFLRGDNVWVDLPATFSGNYQDLLNITGVKGANTFVLSSGASTQAHTSYSLTTIPGQLVNSQVTAGTLDLDRLSASGSRTSSTFLRGDNSWQAISTNSLTSNDTLNTLTLNNAQSLIDFVLNPAENSRLMVRNSSGKNFWFEQTNASGYDLLTFYINNAPYMIINNATSGITFQYDILAGIGKAIRYNSLTAVASVDNDVISKYHFDSQQRSGTLITNNTILPSTKLLASNFSATRFLRGNDSWSDINFSDLISSIANAQIPVNEITINKINATGTASATTYLRGDGSWSTVTGSVQNQIQSLDTLNTMTINNTGNIIDVNMGDTPNLKFIMRNSTKNWYVEHTNTGNIVNSWINNVKYSAVSFGGGNVTHYYDQICDTGKSFQYTSGTFVATDARQCISKYDIDQRMNNINGTGIQALSIVPSTKLNTSGTKNAFTYLAGNDVYQFLDRFQNSVGTSRAILEQTGSSNRLTIKSDAIGLSQSELRQQGADADYSAIVFNNTLKRVEHNINGNLMMYSSNTTASPELTIQNKLRHSSSTYQATADNEFVTKYYVDQIGGGPASINSLSDAYYFNGNMSIGYEYNVVSYPTTTSIGIGYNINQVFTNKSNNCQVGISQNISADSNGSQLNCAQIGNNQFINTTGSVINNACVGTYQYCTSGTAREISTLGYNVTIGNNVGVTMQNKTVIGANTNASSLPDSNCMRFGSAVVSVIQGTVAFTTPSDLRDKKIIAAPVQVNFLDFVCDIKPEWFQFNNRERYTSEDGTKNAITHPDLYNNSSEEHISSRINYNVIAQDILAVQQQHGLTDLNIISDMSYNEKQKGQDTGQKELLLFNSSALCGPFIAAFQQLNKICANQQKQLDSQQAQIEQLTALVNQLVAAQ